MAKRTVQRQSQLITTFGPGAMVDLVDRSVVIGGLEQWGYGKQGYVALDDARLRRSLIPRLKALDTVAYIRFASVYKDFREAKDFEDFAGTVSEAGRTSD